MFQFLLLPLIASASIYANNAEAKPGWADSFSSGGKCYCDSNFDHGLGGMQADTPQGKMNMKDVCDLVGKPSSGGDKQYYNDIQCGNGPANEMWDEKDCPGIPDDSLKGDDKYKKGAKCQEKGPKWDFGGQEAEELPEAEPDTEESTAEEPTAEDDAAEDDAAEEMPDGLSGAEEAEPENVIESDAMPEEDTAGGGGADTDITPVEPVVAPTDVCECPKK